MALGVAGLNSVCDGEAEGAEMVGNNAEGDIILLLLGDGRRGPVARGLRQGGAVGAAAEFADCLEDGAEEVGLVVGDHDIAEFLESLGALDDGADTLKAHAGVDVAGRKGNEGAVRVGIELDEDEIPDLDALRTSLVH